MKRKRKKCFFCQFGVKSDVGGEYELITNKRSYTRIISEEPEQLEPLTRKFATLAKEIHSTQANTDVFPEMKAVVRP